MLKILLEKSGKGSRKFTSQVSCLFLKYKLDILLPSAVSSHILDFSRDIRYPLRDSKVSTCLAEMKWYEKWYVDSTVICLLSKNHYTEGWCSFKEQLENV